MNDRPNDLLRFRPGFKKPPSLKTLGLEERFQNETLRPILKLQNPLLIAVFATISKNEKGCFMN